MPLAGFTPYKKEDAEKYTKLRWWLGITLGDMLDKASDLYPNKEALVDDRSRLTYAQLREKADRLAIGLIKLGIKKGDCILLQLPNWSEFVYSYFALHKIGAIVVLLLSRYAQIEINHLCSLTEATAWIVPEKYRKIDYLPAIDDVLKANPQLRHVILVRGKDSERFAGLERLIKGTELSQANLHQLADRRPEPTAVAQIMPTGGTTGLPKGTPRTHNDFICSVEYKSWAWERNSNDICLVMAPVAHAAALLVGITSTIFAYGKLVLLDSTTPEDICTTIQKERVTCVQLVPALLSRMVNFEGLKDYDLGSLEKIHVGAAHSPPELIKSAYEKLGVKYVVSAYGSVEGTHCNTRMDDSLETILNTVGRPCCPYDKFKVIDRDERELPPNTEGELVCKGPSVFAGYFKSDNAGLFTKDGFFKTGDLAVIGDRGNVRITGRIKDIIIRGGENINATEIEELILQHPNVKDISVVGMPDKELGERVCAYIQPVPGAKPSFDDIVSFLKGKGASVLLLPERIEFIDAIPLTKANKPDKKVLREDIKKRLEKEGKI